MSTLTVNVGGVMFASTDDYQLSGTIRETDGTGPMMSGDYELTGGFWIAQVPGDCLFDGAVNPLDHAAFIDCSGGPNADPTGDGCAGFDLDNDNDVDLDDFGRIQRQFSGS